MNKYYRHFLVAKINGLADKSQQLRAKIKKAKKDEKVWALCSAKRSVGSEARHHLLAYAALRGTPYPILEPSCRIDNKPSAGLILQIIEAHDVPGAWTLERVKAWLQTESLPVAKSAPSMPVIDRVAHTVLSKVLKVLGL
jgi:hypothetical protein